MLFYFILGIVFVTIVLPIMDNLITIIATYTEYIGYIIAAKTYKIKKELEINQDQKEDQHNIIGFSTDVVGFNIPNQEQEFDNDDNDEPEEQ